MTDKHMMDKFKTDKLKMDKLTIHDVDACVDVILSAFKNDPLFTHALKNDAEKVSFSKFLLKKALILDENSIVIKDNITILSVASYERDSGNAFKGLMKMLHFDFIKEAIKLKHQLSPEGFAFFNRYMRFTTSVRPKQPHYYLVFIGITSEAQGRGLGRSMLETIHTRVDSDSESIGIGLDTENEANVAYYEKFGYKLKEQRTIDGVTVYAMFRSKS